MSEEIAKKEKEDVVKSSKAHQELDYTYSPNIDIIESEHELKLLADMPGVDDKSVSVSLEGNELTVTGTVNKVTPADRQLTYREYIPSSFNRTFTLGNAIDRQGIEAKVKDGVLTLILPKSREMQAKRIEVKVG